MHLFLRVYMTDWLIWLRLTVQHENPMTSKTETSKSFRAASGGFWNVLQDSDFPNRKSSSRQMPCPSPPPTEIIWISACINNSSPRPFLFALFIMWGSSFSMSSFSTTGRGLIPTQGYFFLSGQREKRNVSPVPKYRCRSPFSSFSFRAPQWVEQ